MQQSPAIGVIGGGPAGMSCASWLLHYGFIPHLIDRRSELGGALLDSVHPNLWVLGQENCTGVELAQRFSQHIMHERITCHLGMELQAIERTAIGLQLTLGSRLLPVSALVLATGMTYANGRQLNHLPGFNGVERQNAISFIQPSPLQLEALQGTKIAVIGGGDNAFETAVALADNGCEVTLIMRSAPRAQHKFQEQANMRHNIRRIHHSVISGLEQHERGVDIRLSTGETIKALHIFALLGYVAHTEDIRHHLPELEFNNKGFIKTDVWMRTNLPKVYAAGDATGSLHPCVLSALSSGSLAARTIEKDFFR